MPAVNTRRVAADLGDDLIAKVVYTGEGNPPKSGFGAGRTWLLSIRMRAQG